MNNEPVTSITSVPRAKPSLRGPELPPPIPPSLAGTAQPTLRYLPITEIQPDPDNVRKTYDDVEELAEAIRADGGILSSLVVTPATDGQFMIVAGHRRYFAALKLGMSELPVIVRNFTDEEKDAVQISENINRSAVSAIDLAHRMQRMIERYPADDAERIEKVAARLSRERAVVRRYLSLLQLDPRVVKAIEKNRLGVRAALEVRALARTNQIAEALELAAGQRTRDQRKTKPTKDAAVSASRTYEHRGSGFMLRASFTTLDTRAEAAIRSALAELARVHDGGVS